MPGSSTTAATSKTARVSGAAIARATVTKISSTATATKNNNNNNNNNNNMRKTVTGSRKATATASSSGRASAARGGTVRKTTATASSSKTSSGAVKKPYVIRKPKWKPAPRPSMYVICYDFTVKLVRGLLMGLGLGLVFSLAIPWVIDTGEWILDKYYDADLAVDWTTQQISQLHNKTTDQLAAVWKKLPASTTRPPLREVDTNTQQQQEQQQQQQQQLQQLKQRFPRASVPRSITLVHVGHTGGKSLISLSPRIVCLERYSRDEHQAEACAKEVRQQLDAQNISASDFPLTQQLQHYYHLGSSSLSNLQTTTTFLFTLRNPVDRLLATFLDSHPLACTTTTSSVGDVVNTQQQRRPWGCETAEYWNVRGTTQRRFYTLCFPHLNPEPFAQAVASPWDNTTVDNTINDNMVVTSKRKRHRDCRWMARDVARGSTTDSTNRNAIYDENSEERERIDLAPHMHYNYDFYAQETVRKFPSTHEVFVVRSEREQNDLGLLNELLGGSNHTHTLMRKDSSAPLTAPTVTTQAYQKMCCALEAEIEIYESLLKAAVNLPDFAKDESMDDLRQKCGLAENQGWENWRIECRNKLEMDTVLLSGP